ncbi:MAG: hypothetical protein ACOCV4_05160 [Myxococcota bacterium]
MKRVPLTALIVVTSATMAFVAAGMPGLSQVPGWFYRPGHRGLGEALPLAVGAVTVPALLWAGLTWARRDRYAPVLVALVVASFVAQVALVFADARGVDDAFRWQVDGHGEMARLARAKRDALPDILRHYDEWMAQRELGSFTPSKPPGTFAVYVGVDALADVLPVERWLGPLVEQARAHPEIGDRADTAALAFVLFPLLTALALPLVVVLGGLLLGSRPAGFVAGLLTLSSPAVLLIQQHLDGALYPLLALGVVVLATLGARRWAPWWTAAAGVLWGLSLYVSFSLLPVAGLALGAVALVATDGIRGRDRAVRVHRAGWHVAAFGFGAVVGLAALVEGLDFELARRLTNALAYHEVWKRGVPEGPWRAWALAEFAVYLSVPLAAAWLWRAAADGTRLATQRFQPAHLRASGLLLFAVLLSLASGTNEVARLWLFLVPFVALAVAGGLPEAAKGDRWWAPGAWLAACQGVVALVLQANQPW